MTRASGGSRSSCSVLPAADSSPRCWSSRAILQRDETEALTLRIAIAADASGSGSCPGRFQPRGAGDSWLAELFRAGQRALELLAGGMRDARSPVSCTCRRAPVRKLIQRTVRGSGRARAVSVAISARFPNERRGCEPPHSAVAAISIVLGSGDCRRRHRPRVNWEAGTPPGRSRASRSTAPVATRSRCTTSSFRRRSGAGTRRSRPLPIM